jgi:hypothetical protein
VDVLRRKYFLCYSEDCWSSYYKNFFLKWSLLYCEPNSSASKGQLQTERSEVRCQKAFHVKILCLSAVILFVLCCHLSRL